MFDAIGNLPLHPLVVHAVVIGIPLALLLALLFAFPRTRSWARWPLAVTAVGALAVTFVARESGESLQRIVASGSDNPVASLIAQHSQLAGQLLLIMVVFTVVALVNVFVVRSRAAAPPADARSGGVAAMVLPLVLVLVGLVAGFWVYRVGDIGSRAVWNPTGTQDYSNTGSR